ncbi:hypothetical protein ACQPXM_13155 [Kribbella sp. CA-253562]|uniref:hypothetical protein n=1 Tax=Kribbella sp. CA-253562 TaxID=3239942 RepID=UPI003D89CB55
MTDDPGPSRDPFRWIWRASLFVFGSVVLLNLAVAYLQPIMPWLIGAAGVAVLLWVVVAVIRWRRNRW